MARRTELLKGTLDLLILKTLELEPRHGIGAADRIEQITRGTFNVKAGSLFPALHRLEQEGFIARLTAAGRRQLGVEQRQWTRLDATGVYLGVRDLRANRGSLLRAVAAAGDVDAAISVASYRAGRRDWTRPRFRPVDATTELAELRHPLVDDAEPNSIALCPGRGVLVTGSNMSGKSTFLRTVGVNAILAQAINTCLARQYAAPVFNVRSCIGRADDLLTGKSYYIVEVEALLGLVRASENSAPHLFLLDELFRATNAVERIAAGQAVLHELLGGGGTTKPHVVLAATHDGELVELLPESFDAYHFGDSIGPDGLVFDYRLKHGPATTRNAIALLRLHGAPEALLKRAMTTAGMLDRQRGTTLMAR